MESQKKACQHRDGYHDGPQHATIGRGADNVCLRDLRLRVDSCDIASHISPMEYCPVKKQTDHGDGTEVGEKVAIGDAGHGANQHILRIAGNGRHATDVGSGSKRQQVGKGTQSHPLADAEDEWGHEQTNYVVHQECRKNSTSEDHAGQYLAGSEMEYDAVADPVEK